MELPRKHSSQCKMQVVVLESMYSINPYIQTNLYLKPIGVAVLVMHTYTAHTFHVRWSIKSLGFISYIRCSGIAIIWLKYCRYDVKHQTIIQPYTSSKPPKCASNMHWSIYIELRRSIIRWKAILSTDSRLCHSFIQIPWNGPNLHLPPEYNLKWKILSNLQWSWLRISVFLPKSRESIPQSYEANLLKASQKPKSHWKRRRTYKVHIL